GGRAPRSPLRRARRRGGAVRRSGALGGVRGAALGGPRGRGGPLGATAVRASRRGRVRGAGGADRRTVPERGLALRSAGLLGPPARRRSRRGPPSGGDPSR